MSRGDRFSKKGQGNSAQDEVGRTIYDRAHKLLNNRWKYLNQFDVVNDYHAELYRYALTDDEWAAWDLLRRNPQVSRLVSTSQYLVVRNTGGKFSITFDRPGEKFMQLTVDWGSLPQDTQLKIHNWMIRSESYRWETEAITKRIKSLVMCCATAGQIERVWPELLGFMPEETIDTRFVKKARSPYPDGVWEEGWELLHPRERKLKEKWRPEVLDWFNNALTESLILPQQDWQKYPPFPRVEFQN